MQKSKVEKHKIRKQAAKTIVFYIEKVKSSRIRIGWNF